MKRSILIVALLASLTGCYQVTSAGDIDAADKFCKYRGGVNNITVDFLGQERVTCQDEMKTYLHR